MASEQAELTTNPTDVATALSEDGGKNEKTAVSGESGDERTSLHELDDSWSWPAYTSSLASDYSLKREHLFVPAVLLLASVHVLRRDVRQSEEHVSVNVIDIRAAFPLSEEVWCRLEKLFMAKDIEGWLKLLPRTVEVDEVNEVVFVLTEQQLNLVAQVESLKSRKEAFAILLEEKQQLLAEERKRYSESELERAGLKELNGKLGCEVEQLKKVVAELNERVEMLLGNLEHSKKELVAKVNQAEIALKGKWELERQELVWRVSELEAALAQQGAKEEHTNTEAEGAVRPADSALEEELARVQKELSGSKEKAAILIEMYKESKSTIEELLMETARLKSEHSAMKMQQEIGKTYDMSTLLKENANLRSALKTVEQMKMELENEKVAVQDQLLEYQRRCGVFNKPLPPSTYKTTAAVGKARASADGIVKATLAPSVRACPFCKREFGQFECSERQFMDHVNNCRD